MMYSGRPALNDTYIADCERRDFSIEGGGEMDICHLMKEGRGYFQKSL